ncbi:MAG: alpha-mannosidase [Promethearchaeota archaeon]
MEYKFLDKIGFYSGNKRIDTSTFTEPDPDTEKVRERWLGKDKEINIKRRLNRWKSKISKTMNSETIQVHMVGQSHIDMAWMWRFEQTRKKAIITFRKAILHSKMFPEMFCFALSEPLLLEWVQEDDPELFKQIQETVKAGNIELVGGSYIEPDCMMPSGEAMVRQRLYGMRFYRDNFGVLPRVEWFLDSFGYNYGLPQILVKSGANYFWTTKITWNRDTTFPFVNFWWQGPDGTRILTANFGMGTEPLEWWDKYEIGRHLLKKDGRKVWNYTMDYSKLNEHVEDEICPLVGFFFGLGDGGHGPTHKEVAFANEYAKLDMFKWSRVETFYEGLGKYSEKFPVWNDELYLETHRGCFSNHAEVKRHNRKYENILISLEALALLSSLNNSKYQYPMEDLELLWKLTLKNQFHDVLPGSSIPEVYDEVWDDWNEQDIIIEKIISEIGLALTGEIINDDLQNSADIYLYNPVAWERKSRVFIPRSVFKNTPMLDINGKPKYAKLEFLNGDNEIYICQPIAAEPEDTIDRMPAGWWAVVKLRPLSSTHARIIILNELESEKIKKQTKLKASQNYISNSKVSIKLDPITGAMVGLTAEKINNENNLLKGNSSNLTFGFLDNVQVGFHAWNLTPEYWNHPINLSNDKDMKINVSEIGPVFATLEINRILGVSPVIQKITLFKDCQEIFLDYLANWKQKDIMLKVLFSTSTGAEIAVADATYCAIEFKTNPEVPCDKARYEKICHDYFDLSTPDNKWGLAMINEGKYAFDVKGGDMRLTMLRACRYPISAPEAWVNIERTENTKQFNHEIPKYSGLGPFKCRYALLPHAGGTITNADGSPNVIVKRKAQEFNAPIIVIPTEGIQENQQGIATSGKSLLEILTPNVYLGVLKLNEWKKTGTIIIRFIEGSGISSLAKVKFNSVLSEKISKIQAVDLLERGIERDFKWDKETRVFSFDIGKFEISTFELYI